LSRGFSKKIEKSRKKFFLDKNRQKKLPGAAGNFFVFDLEIILDQLHTRTADLLIVEIDEVISLIAKCTGALCLLNNDLCALGVNLQIIVAINLQLASQFFWQHETAQTVNTTHNAGILHGIPPFRYNIPIIQKNGTPVNRKSMTQR
jgi:hypothetical protein